MNPTDPRSRPISAAYQPQPDAFAERVILVTGATGGIGAAVCRSLSAAGATVILLDRELKALETLYDELVALGPEPAIYPMNLEGAAFEHYPEMAARIGGELGRLDGILHAAAVLGRPAPVELYDIEAWYRTLQVNLNAPFMLTRACLPLLRESPDASVVFTSDRVGREGGAYWGAYATAKAGLEGLMRVLADEVEARTRIRVNTLAPGPVATALRMDAYPAEDRTHLAQPEDVAGAFVRLLGPDGASHHGEALHVEPGRPGTAS